MSFFDNTGQKQQGRLEPKNNFSTVALHLQFKFYISQQRNGACVLWKSFSFSSAYVAVIQSKILRGKKEPIWSFVEFPNYK